MADSTSPSENPLAARTEETSISPEVIVPVLSRQSVSTRASVSTQYACWTRTIRRPSRKVAMARTEEVSRTSPCGIMPMTAATEVRIASSRLPPSMRTDLRKRPRPSGTSATVPSRMMARSVSWISDLTALTYLASALMRAA